MTFCLRRGTRIKSDYEATIIKHSPLSTYTRRLRFDFLKLFPFYSLPKPHHVTTSHPSPCDKPPEIGRAFLKVATWNVRVSTPSYLSCIVAVSTVIPLLPKPTITSSSQPNLGLFRSRRPLTSHLQQTSSHTVLIISLQVSEPFLYSLIRFTQLGICLRNAVN